MDSFSSDSTRFDHLRAKVRIPEAFLYSQDRMLESFSQRPQLPSSSPLCISAILWLGRLEWLPSLVPSHVKVI
jgi:hypothetical protein